MYDKIYLSSNIAFLLDCYINSFKYKQLCIIDKDPNLGGAWQVSDARVHMQWVNDKNYIDSINKDLSFVDAKYQLQGPLKYIKTLDNKKYTDYSIYHINTGSNVFIQDLINKIRLRPNIRIIEDTIKTIDNSNVYGMHTYKFKELYLTNNISLDNYTNVDKTYKHLFIEVISSRIDPLDVLIAEVSYYKSKTRNKLLDSLFFLLNVTTLYPSKPNTQYFSCRIKTDSFVKDFKDYLIASNITEKDVSITALEEDTYAQTRLQTFNPNKYRNVHYFTSMNYFKFLVKCGRLR